MCCAKSSIDSTNYIGWVMGKVEETERSLKRRGKGQGTSTMATQKGFVVHRTLGK